MPFDNNTPQPTDPLNATQPPILGNFVQLQSSFDQNHVGLNAGTGSGKHTYIEMPRQTVTATPTGATEGMIYAILDKKQGSGGTNETQLYWRRQNSTTDIAITGGDNTTNGWSYGPNGLLLKWGKKSVNAVDGPSQTISFSAGPAFGTVYSVNATFQLLSAATVNGLLQISSYNTSDLFVIVTGLNGTTAISGSVNWFAVGVPS